MKNSRVLSDTGGVLVDSNINSKVNGILNSVDDLLEAIRGNDLAVAEFLSIETIFIGLVLDKFRNEHFNVYYDKPTNPVWEPV
jgi:hypothetical protein